MATAADLKLAAMALRERASSIERDYAPQGSREVYRGSLSEVVDRVQETYMALRLVRELRDIADMLEAHP